MFWCEPLCSAKYVCLQINAGGEGFLCVGGPHMASGGRGSDDGKARTV